MNKPSPEPFALDGDRDTAVLLLHGLTGSPAEMRPLGEALAARGFAVRAPLLPGHGDTVDALRRTPGRAWVEHADAELSKLRASHARVAVGALSMGTLVATQLAARHELAGLFVMAPALEVNVPVPLWFAGGLRYVWRYAKKGPSPDDHLDDQLWCYDRYPIASLFELWRLQRAAERVLSEVRAPALVIGGRKDTSVPAASVERYFEALGSRDKALLWMNESGHALPVDREREAIFARVTAFLDER